MLFAGGIPHRAPPVQSQATDGTSSGKICRSGMPCNVQSDATLRDWMMCCPALSGIDVLISSRMSTKAVISGQE
jgi:hypothetical protein